MIEETIEVVEVVGVEEDFCVRTHQDAELVFGESGLTTAGSEGQRE